MRRRMLHSQFADTWTAPFLLLPLLVVAAHGQETEKAPRVRLVKAGPSRERMPGGFGNTLWADRVGGRELVAIGAPWAGSKAIPRHGEVIALVDGEFSWRATGAHAEEHLGCSLAGVDRVGTGVPDALAISTGPFRNLLKASMVPERVELRSLSSGKVLLELPARPAGDGFGSALAEMGDVDGDGWAELAIGAPQPAPERGLVPRNPGYVSLFSTKDGTVLWTTTGRESDRRFGATLARVGDIDRDGHADLLVGVPGPLVGASWSEDPPQGAGAILALSAASGEVLYEVWTEGQYLDLGRALEPAGDLDGDGCSDAVAAAFGGLPCTTGDGEVLLISGANGKAGRIAGLSMLRVDRASLAVGTDVDGSPLIAVGEPWVEWSGGVVQLFRPSGELLARFEATSEDCTMPDSEFCHPDVGVAIEFLGRRDADCPPRWVVSAPAGPFLWGSVIFVEGTDWAHRSRVLEQDLLPEPAGR